MKILVIDDEPDNKTLFEQRFRKETKNGGLQFAFAFSGEEALAYLHGQEHDAMLILSDITMPGISGLELLERIKTTYTNPPRVVIMITACIDAQSYDTAKGLGADDLLTKPIDFALLKQKLKPIIDGKNFSG